MRWIFENPPRWDAPKRRMIAQAPTGIFDARYKDLREGSRPPGEWWRVEEGGRTLGYGWLDVVWGDAEILLITDAESRHRGVGKFILEQLENEARKRQLNYMYNIVRPTHPEGKRLARWLEKNGFQPGEDGRLVRAVGHRLE